jgi:hypothetical protein
MISNEFTAVYVILSLLSFTLFIFVLVKFFKATADLKEIRNLLIESSQSTFKKILLLKMTGKEEDAMRIVREEFVKDAGLIFLNYGIDQDWQSKGWELIYKYLTDYKFILPNLKKEILKELFETVEKLYQ